MNPSVNRWKRRSAWHFSRAAVEPATELLKTPHSLRVGVTGLSPEAAAVPAAYKGELRFEVLATLSPETAAASEEWSGEGSLSVSPRNVRGERLSEHRHAIPRGLSKPSK